MVAPTRAPQVRGVKCDLCKRILASATWIDQTKLAKSVAEAQSVLDLISEHKKSDCLCIPKNIENLLVGSTHFEIHKLESKHLDSKVHAKQYQNYVENKQKLTKEMAKAKNETINDCIEVLKTSRFKLYADYNNKKFVEISRVSLKHLEHSVDYWKMAMEDQASPFNPKLALRLGLTHHVIYACYLFKYYKILNYQLISANLLLNLFSCIEEVKTNAILHAYFLLVRSLMDCSQFQLARQSLKEATKIVNYQDKSYYESILLTCTACELDLLENGPSYQTLDTLADLATIKPDDKLQHFYARTLAISVVIRYIHCYPARSELCYEFYHAFRYIGAIIRRCYESSFEIVLLEKDTKQLKQSVEPQQNQILDHSWIRFAVCDFAFSSFDLLSNFYIRAGQPESLELLYNGLNLVSYRNGSFYWQSRLAIIGAELDLLCDKFSQAETKLDAVSSLIGHTSDTHLMNLLRLDLEVSLILLLNQKGTGINKEVSENLLQRLSTCQASLAERISKVELYDCRTRTNSKLVVESDLDNDLIALRIGLKSLSLKVLKILTSALIQLGDVGKATDLVVKAGDQLSKTNCKVLEYYDSQIIQEMLLLFTDINRSEQILLEASTSDPAFLDIESDISIIESQISLVTLNGDSKDKAPQTRTSKRNITKSKAKISKLSIGKQSKRRGTYDVALETENMFANQSVKFYDTIECIKNFPTLSAEELVVSYLRNSEPNPDYLLYRRAHELMVCFRLKDELRNHEQLLYHFCESATTNSMRYRWMMLEEQQASPFDAPTAARCNGSIKYLGFSNALANRERTIKSFTRAIPDDYRILQIKYVPVWNTQEEHLLIASFDSESIPIYIHTKKSIASDDFFNDAKVANKDLTLPARLLSKIDESKRSLLMSNHRSRTEIRKKLEEEVRVLLHDLENEWLGPFRILLGAKICDTEYNEFVRQTVTDLQSIMNNHSCISATGLNLVVENAPLVSREEFCQLISVLYSCPSNSSEVRDCFNKWTKSVENFVATHAPGLNKTSYMQTLDRGQLGLILDKELEFIPFESLPLVRVIKQGTFRVPSLRLFHVIASKHCNSVSVDASKTSYILDPASNLSKTRERFESKLRSQKSWVGVMSEAPKTELLEEWFKTKDIYIFIGHGAGTVYYNKLCRGRGLGAMSQIKPVSIIMGCSSGRVQAEGPRLESFGIGWVFIFRGAPSYVGLLWDVTDTDIDRFLDLFLGNWLNGEWHGEQSGRINNGSQDLHHHKLLSTDAATHARHASGIQFKFLVGSTPVVYGLPVKCKTRLQE